MATLNSKIPTGPLAEKWRKHKTEIKLVNPANKRKYEIIVVGAGLAGASAASSLADLGYKVVSRRITRDDVYIADEAFFTGTAACSCASSLPF